MYYRGRIRSQLSHHLATHPKLFFPFYKLATHQDNEALVVRDTEIVIEGFPRSGNTFAFVAFQLAQAQHVKVAHHLHVEAQILEGLRLGIPVLVLIRKPEQAIRSLLIRHPEVEASFALRRYNRFYTNVYRVHNQVVIGEFSKVTTDFGQVIKAVNDKFGTSFEIFQHTEQNVVSAFKEIESINNQFDQGQETHVARPSRYRKDILDQSKIHLPEDLLERANWLFWNLSN